MKRVWLGDAVGVIAALVAVAVLPSLDDPLTYVKLIVLAAGGLALLPWGVARWWKRCSVPASHSRLLVIPVGAAVCLAIWSLISFVATGVPWAVGLFGWFGRADGVLALFGAVGLMVSASSLRLDEVQRAVNWLLVGAAIACAVGLLQVFGGVSFPRGSSTDVVTATMGNQNFAAGYLAIMLSLSVGCALMVTRSRVQRMALALLALVICVEIFLAESLQGPVAAAAGLVVGGTAWSWIDRGPRRALWRSLSSVICGLVAALLVASAFGAGPLTRLWSESTFGIRQQYWSSAINMMSDLPVFGTGPGSFARYIGEYRPDSYVATLGPNLNVSAAHNVALHIGATLGVFALALWLLVFAGVSLAFLLRMKFIAPSQALLSSALLGALAAYVVQGLVSIDMLPLLATGWVIAGLVLAAAVGEDSPRLPQAGPPAKGRRQPVVVDTKVPRITVALSGLLGVGALVLTCWQAAAFGSIAQATSVDEAVQVIDSPLTPCTIRLSLIESATQQLPADVVVPLLDRAVAIDPRCPAMKSLQAQVALQTGSIDQAGVATSEVISFDPKYYFSWILRAEYFLAVGDVAGASDAYMKAIETQALYPDRTLGVADITALRARLIEKGADLPPYP